MSSPVFPKHVVDDVAAIIEEANRTGARVSAGDKVKAILDANKLSWTARVPVDFVGVHPQNRNGLGVGGSDAHFHGLQILTAGFSWTKASDATAFECSPDDTAAADCNDKWVKLSGGLLPDLTAMKLLSIGGAHTNGFLRAVKAQCRTTIASLADGSGKLSLDRLAVGRPEFRDACENGLRWLVVHRDAPKVWPGLAMLIQKALNTEAQGQQSEVECMLDIFALYKDACTNPPADWTLIQEAVCYSMPPCSSYIGVVCSYVREHAGDGELLMELSQFQKAFETSGAARRIIGSEFLQKLASMKFPLGKKHPHLVTACVKANLSSPAHKVTDGVGKLLPVSVVSTLVGKKMAEHVGVAEDIMHTARLICDMNSVPDHIKVQKLGKLDCRIVLFLCNKLKDSEKTSFSTLDNIGEVHISRPELTQPQHSVGIQLYVCSTLQHLSLSLHVEAIS